MIKNFLSKFIYKSSLDKTNLKEDLETVLDNKSNNTDGISKQERVMLMNILKIDEILARDIMIPRAEIIALEESISFDEAIKIFVEGAHSRIPIYNEQLDNITGMLHIKDLVKYQTENDIKGNFIDSIKKDILHIPPSMPALDLLIKMQLTRLHMGVVIDEYGGVDGLITIEDVIEEITGEIEDEHDDKDISMFIKLSPNTFEANARLSIAELEKISQIQLINEDDDTDTIGGLVATVAGRVPQRGEIIKHDSGIVFTILDADPRRIKTIKISLPK
ncbi:hemolysin family protein [Pelagibacterales bacterium]|mgnify:FL=1|jgi:magnesium and cobalt transporter|nr:HlyC/CorC family transporter [Pelagibacterales bacterium]MBL6861839.1 HlyC/CorC family transporter [Pelagibacterales bacterium]MDB9985699.1 hemolysin family protein [Pelagibacterales bacterium]